MAGGLSDLLAIPPFQSWKVGSHTFSECRQSELHLAFIVAFFALCPQASRPAFHSTCASWTILVAVKLKLWKHKNKRLLSYYFGQEIQLAQFLRYTWGLASIIPCPLTISAPPDIDTSAHVSPCQSNTFMHVDVGAHRIPPESLCQVCSVVRWSVVKCNKHGTVPGKCRKDCRMLSDVADDGVRRTCEIWYTPYRCAVVSSCWAIHSATDSWRSMQRQLWPKKVRALNSTTLCGTCSCGCLVLQQRFGARLQEQLHSFNIQWFQMISMYPSVSI